MICKVNVFLAKLSKMALIINSQYVNFSFTKDYLKILTKCFIEAS